MSKSDLLSNILIRSIKIADIGYIFSLLGLVGIGLATGLNALYGDFNKESEDKKSIVQVVLEIILMLWLNGILIYIFLNIFELVPSPFHGLYGYNHAKTFKSYSQVPLALTLLWFQTYLFKKIQYYKDRVVPSGSSTITPTFSTTNRPTMVAPTQIPTMGAPTQIPTIGISKTQAPEQPNEIMNQINSFLKPNNTSKIVQPQATVQPKAPVVQPQATVQPKAPAQKLAPIQPKATTTRSQVPTSYDSVQPTVPFMSNVSLFA